MMCRDSRLDKNEIAGDTRRYYYVLRLAGSVLAEKEEEMLAHAVASDVRVVVFTTHTGQKTNYPDLVMFAASDKWPELVTGRLTTGIAFRAKVRSQ